MRRAVATWVRLPQRALALAGVGPPTPVGVLLGCGAGACLGRVKNCCAVGGKEISPCLPGGCSTAILHRQRPLGGKEISPCLPGGCSTAILHRQRPLGGKGIPSGTAGARRRFPRVCVTAAHLALKK